MNRNINITLDNGTNEVYKEDLDNLMSYIIQTLQPQVDQQDKKELATLLIKEIKEYYDI